MSTDATATVLTQPLLDVEAQREAQRKRNEEALLGLFDDEPAPGPCAKKQCPGPKPETVPAPAPEPCAKKQCPDPVPVYLDTTTDEDEPVYLDTTTDEDEEPNKVPVGEFEEWVKKALDDEVPLHLIVDGKLQENRDALPVAPAEPVVPAPPPVVPAPIVDPLEEESLDRALEEEGLNRANIRHGPRSTKGRPPPRFGRRASKSQVDRAIGPGGRHGKYKGGHYADPNISLRKLRRLCKRDKERRKEWWLQVVADEYADKDQRRLLKRYLEGREKRQKEGKGRDIRHCV